jgi:2-(1,2-epoxy-1,2-dihydrophenyl)acetyl-CoA isomerase
VNRRASVTIDADSGIARLRLVRGAGNAIDLAMVEQIGEATHVLAAHSHSLRAVLIDADGPHFTVGGDLAHFHRHRHRHRLADELGVMVEAYHESVLTLAELPVPVVCAVHGAAAGGGLGLLWCSDIVIAAHDVKILTAFARLGVSGDGGSSWFLPRLVGLRTAQQLTLESPVLDAAAALRYGLVTRVVDRADLAAEADATVRRLATGPTVGLGLQRALLRHANTRTLREGLNAELAAMRISGASTDAAEGISAFIRHQRPSFHGR